MNNKPFTLYYINSLKFIHCDNFPIIAGKISDAKCISKGITLKEWKENNNRYAIFGDNPNIISMGMVKTIETKNKNIIYIGEKIYSNSQKELYDYVKREVTYEIQKIKKEIARIQTIKCTNTDFIGSDYYQEYIGLLYKQIKIINTNLKQLIINLKNA